MATVGVKKLNKNKHSVVCLHIHEYAVNIYTRVFWFCDAYRTGGRRGTLYCRATVFDPLYCDTVLLSSSIRHDQFDMQRNLRS